MECLFNGRILSPPFLQHLPKVVTRLVEILIGPVTMHYLIPLASGGAAKEFRQRQQSPPVGSSLVMPRSRLSVMLDLLPVRILLRTVRKVVPLAFLPKKIVTIVKWLLRVPRIKRSLTGKSLLLIARLSGERRRNRVNLKLCFVTAVRLLLLTLTSRLPLIILTTLLVQLNAKELLAATVLAVSALTPTGDRTVLDLKLYLLRPLQLKRLLVVVLAALLAAALEASLAALRVSSLALIALLRL